jgi:P27 family predicted phage terminase small subunit
VKPGPAPRPTRLVVIDGNPGKRALNEREPRPAQGCAMPEGLSEPAQAHWRRLSLELGRVGLLTRLDGVGLGLLCQALAEMDAANAIVASHGVLVRAPKSGTPMPNPALPIARNAAERVRKLLAELGMTPAARSRVSTEGDEDGAPDPWAELAAMGTDTDWDPDKLLGSSPKRRRLRAKAGQPDATPGEGPATSGESAPT